MLTVIRIDKTSKATVAYKRGGYVYASALGGGVR